VLRAESLAGRPAYTLRTPPRVGDWKPQSSRDRWTVSRPVPVLGILPVPRRMRSRGQATTPGKDGLAERIPSVGSFAGAVEKSCRRDRGLKQGGIDDALEPYHAGVGQFDLQLRARGRLEN
jgi:hypothetical protein